MTTLLVLEDYSDFNRSFRSGDIVDSAQFNITELVSAGLSVTPYSPAMEPRRQAFLAQRGTKLPSAPDLVSMLLAGGLLSSVQPTLTAAVNADTSALALWGTGPAVFAPTADRRIDITNAPGSGIVRIIKSSRVVGAGIFLDVSADPTWTTPAGLGQEYMLQSSDDQVAQSYELLYDQPNKTVYVLTSGRFDVMSPAPSAAPADTLDLSVGGVFAGAAIATRLFGAPTSDGSAFMDVPGLNVRRMENRGDGHGSMLLLEPAKTNLCFQSQTMSVAPWAAVGGTTYAAAQAGSPLGTATSTDLIFTALATDASSQPVTVAAQLTACFSVWAKMAAGVGAVRLRFTDKSGTVFTGPDEALTTTWKRIWLAIPSTGRFGAAGTAAVAIVNGSDGVARTVRCFGAQFESGQTWPSSYIPTVAASVARSADSLYYAPGAYPASFCTRGVSGQVAVDGTSEEFFQCGFNGALASFDNDRGIETFPVGGDPYGPIADRNWLFFCGPANEAPAAEGRARLGVFCGRFFYGNTAAGNPLNVPRWSRSFTWARNTLLTMAFEAYRGGVRVAGALTGNGRTTLGAGPFSYPNGSFGVGSVGPGAAAACCLRIKPTLSAA